MRKTAAFASRKITRSFPRRISLSDPLAGFLTYGYFFASPSPSRLR